STLVSAMTAAYREQGKTVAVVAVDPSSPFSGGAILGDRIRMRDHAGDTGVFIRSMAARGNPGGLALTTRDIARVLDAAGFDIVIIETVGAGQSEVAIVRSAYTTIVVEAPGMGDDVQAIKAGILEIADILVINKADRVGARQTERALKMMLELGHPVSKAQDAGHHGRLLDTVESQIMAQDTFWMPSLIQTVATKSTGIAELIQKIDDHRQYLTANLAQFTRSADVERELYDRLREKLIHDLKNTLSNDTMTVIIQQVQSRQLDPETAAQQLLKIYQMMHIQQT
ncbi:MAG: methylmalonyl Co-A mutase-associated GTPase MeaB, partial [Aggregatilineales bacterium]